MNMKKILVFSGLAFLLLSRTPPVKKIISPILEGLPMTRGFRNNNPFNIKKTAINWAGKIANSKNTDGTFEQFVDVNMGLRAGMVNLRTHISKGYNTVQKLISRHAPKSENNTASFVKFVCQKIGGSPDTVISANNKDLFVKFAAAIVQMENGHALPESLIYDVYEKYIRKA